MAISPLKNHSSKNSGGIVALIRLFCLLHSWMWFEIWVALSYRKVDNKSVLKSYRTGSWKWLRNTLAKSQKLLNATEGNSIYHFVALLVRVLCNSLNQTESSFSELEENHKWKVVTWALESSPTLPSNFGISEGSLVGTGGQEELCLTGSFISFDKSGKFNIARKWILGLTGALKVPSWELGGLYPIFPYVKVELPLIASCEVVRLLWKWFHP